MSEGNSVDDERTSARNAADVLFAAREDVLDDVLHEPRTNEGAAAAVERFAELFDGLPGAVTRMMDNAEGGAELLSSDPFQGLSEIIQNADDASATQVRFLYRPGELLVAHDGDRVRLRDVLALAMPWLTTKAPPIRARLDDSESGL